MRAHRFVQGQQRKGRRGDPWRGGTLPAPQRSHRLAKEVRGRAVRETARQGGSLTRCAATEEM